MKISSGCQCVAAMLLVGGLVAIAIYHWWIEPQIARHRRDMRETYIHRPVGNYRHQYWWKRPFLSYPYSFRRPFRWWRPAFFNQSPLEAVPKTASGSCQTMPEGTTRLNEPRINESWTIAFDMRFYPAISEDDKLVFRVGEAYPSPMLAYSPIDNTLAMILYTHFDGYITKIINVDNMATGEWNNIVWVQNGQWMTIYVNGDEKLHLNVGAIPKTSRGSMYMDETQFVQYKNISVCDFPWTRERLNWYLGQKN